MLSAAAAMVEMAVTLTGAPLTVTSYPPEREPSSFGSPQDSATEKDTAERTNLEATEGSWEGWMLPAMVATKPWPRWATSTEALSSPARETRASW